MLKELLDKLPTLDRDQRMALLGRVEEGVGSNSDYHVMMLLSSGLASLGLLEGSTAVAIAAALVPPLCVVGIGLTNDRPMVAANSAILLLTNLVAIILSAAGAFKILGVRGAGTSVGLKHWVPRTFLVLFMVALVLLLPLMSNVAQQKRRGQTKPLNYPVAEHVYQAVANYLETIPGMTLVTIGRVSMEPASSINIMLTATGKVPPGTRAGLTRLVLEVRGGDPIVRIIVVREVEEESMPDQI